MRLFYFYSMLTAVGIFLQRQHPVDMKGIVHFLTNDKAQHL